MEPGEVAQPQNKIHIRGLDTLKTTDLEDYVTEHYGAGQLDKIEWIDDTSANLVFADDQTAAAALSVLTDTADNVDTDMDADEPTTHSPSELRAAKSLSTYPHVDLSIRIANDTDVKPYRAPRRPPRPTPNSADRLKNVPRKSAFDESMYDEQPDPEPRRQTGDLLDSGRRSGRLRSRSASPLRDGDGRYGFEQSGPDRRTARYRSPPPARRTIDNYEAKAKVKELFPGKAAAAGVAQDRREEVRELFGGLRFKFDGADSDAYMPLALRDRVGRGSKKPVELFQTGLKSGRGSGRLGEEGSVSFKGAARASQRGSTTSSS